MKINNNFILRKIAGESILIPTWTTTQNFNGLISLNGMATFIWENLGKVDSVDDLINLVLDEYDVDYDTAKTDIQEFVKSLQQVGIVE